MSLQGKSLYVLTPMYGGNLTINYHNAFVQLGFLCQKNGINFGSTQTYNESLISRARNRMVDTYLKQDSSTHCLLVDADIGFDPRDVLAMMEMDKDILGVPCSKKSLRWDRIQNAILRRAFEWAHNNPACQNGQNAEGILQAFLRSGRQFNPADLPRIGGDFVLNFPKFEGEKTIQLNEPEPMKHVGTGMLMVKREVFLNFKKAYPNRWYEAKNDSSSMPGPIHDFFKVGVNLETREYDSEDYWFCNDCIAIGYKVLLLPSVVTTHMGTNTFIGDMPSALALAGTIF